MNQIESIKELLKSQGVLDIHAYSRKSRDVDGDGLKKHHDVMKEFADSLGYPLKMYEEVESSETLNRPMLNKLRGEIEQKKIKCLMVYRLDRLSRKVTDMERLIKEFKFHDVILIEAHRKQVVNYAETLGIKLESIMSDLYQEQAKMVLYAGRQKAVQLYGHHLGLAPLGYDYNKETKVLVLNDKAWVVKKIFDLYIEGYCTFQIAVKMNQLGVRSNSTRGTGEMIPSTIHRILKNEKYKGSQVYGKEEFYKDGDGKVYTKKRPESEWMVYENAHEPIIDSETFEQVQKLLVERQRVPHKSRRRKFALTQIIKCGKCGKRMSFIKAGTGTYRNDTIRTCFMGGFATGERCGNKGLPAYIVEGYVKEKIWDEVRPLILKAQRELAKGTSSKLSQTKVDKNELKTLKSKRNDIEKQINHAIDLQIELGKDDRLLAKIRQLQAQLETIKQDIERLEQEDPNDVLKWVELYMEQNEDLLGFPLNFKGKAPEEQNLFLSRYVDYVEVLDGKITGIKYQKDVERLISLTS